LIAFVLFTQELLGLPGHLSELVPGDPDTTVLSVAGNEYWTGGTFEVAFGAGCEDFVPEMDVLVLAGSGGVASLTDVEGNGLCNVLIGSPV
jgi:hypothetical protein